MSKKKKIYLAYYDVVDSGDEIEIRAHSLSEAQRKAQQICENDPDFVDMRLVNVIPMEANNDK